MKFQHGETAMATTQTHTQIITLQSLGGSQEIRYCRRSHDGSSTHQVTNSRSGHGNALLSASCSTLKH